MENKQRDEIDIIQYVKEERPPSAHNLSRVIDLLKDKQVGIFGGAFGRWMLSELDRGACGFMPASDTVDVHVAIWDAWQSGNKEEARDIFDAVLPLINLYMLLGFNSVKHVLVQRGIIDNANALAPGAPALDKYDIKIQDVRWGDCPRNALDKNNKNLNNGKLNLGLLYIF